MQERELGWEAALRGTTPRPCGSCGSPTRRSARLETPEDVARVGRRSWPATTPRFVTGEALAVNGGAHMD